jgi:hypothetical protein
VPLFTSTAQGKEKIQEEEKYVNTFKQIGIDKGFYFSYTYDLTHSLQENILRKVTKQDKVAPKRSKSTRGLSPQSVADSAFSFNDRNKSKRSKDENDFIGERAEMRSKYSELYMHDLVMGQCTQGEQLKEHKPWDSQMMWNYFLIKEFYNCVKRKKWIIPIVHGSIDFKNFVYNEKKFTLVLLARRSRQYAGVRYLKRGLNMEGRVANWVEVEQIVWIPPMCPNIDPIPSMTSYL